jgi:putative heme-binding domain-containing protein
VNGLYQNYLVETRDGKMFEGIIASESAAGVVVRQANGLDTSVQLPNIALIRRQGRALMPDGLEMGLDSQDMADLLAFIVQGP